MEYSVLSMTPCCLFTQMLFLPSATAQSQREREISFFNGENQVNSFWNISLLPRDSSIKFLKVNVLIYLPFQFWGQIPASPGSVKAQ